MKTLLVLTMLILALNASATVINVPDEYSSIQLGIDVAADGDTVLVSPGIYYENINFNGHNIVLGSLYLTTGDASYISQTVIDGDSSGSVVIFENGETDATVICGFTIQNGLGGGVEHNWLSGGITCKGYSNPIIRNNVIARNSASRGGGINCQDCSPLISDNVITENTGELGGGIWAGYAGTNPEVCNNIISYNTSESSGGGIFVQTYSGAFIHNNSLHGNRTYSRGGGIQCNYYSTATIKANLIYENHANYGGGIATELEDLSIIEGNTILNNDAYFGGGIAITFQSSTVIFNNLVINNTGILGGGIFLDNGDNKSRITNNTVCGNEADSGGGIWLGSGSRAKIVNSIIWNNIASDATNSIGVYNSSDPFSIAYCDINEEFAGEGNQAVDPCFRNPAENDYHLMSISCGDSIDSPCIDSGDPLLSDSLLDCSWGLGELISDMGAYGGNMESMLYYLPGDANMNIEAWPPALIGSDVTYLVNYFRGSPTNPPCLMNGFYACADVNGDCLVIGSDVTRLVLHFRGQADIFYCPDYETDWPNSSYLPNNMPEGWPFCED